MTLNKAISMFLIVSIGSHSYLCALIFMFEMLPWIPISYTSMRTPIVAVTPFRERGIPAPCLQ